MTRGAVLVVCAALTTAFSVAGCGSDDANGASSTSTAAEAQSTADGEPATGAATSTDKVEISNFAFAPEAIKVNAGTEVTWTNDDDARHTATADDGSFDTGDLDRGDSASATFDEPGTYSYFCRFHAFMKATVEVE